MLLLGTAAMLKYARIGRLRGDTVRYFAAFASARDVMTGTDVWLSGRKVGRVESIRFAPPSSDTAHRVVIELEVLAQERDLIRGDSYAIIRTGSRLLGAQVVYIAAGTSAAPPLPPSDTIATRIASDLEAMAARFGDVAREVPAIVGDGRLLAASLASTRGTIGALTALDAPKRIEALLDNTSRLAARATDGTGTVDMALERGEVLQRARATAAQVDSLRALLASERTSLGRFRRDSTLLASVAELRDEVSLLRARLAARGGTLTRFSIDSALAVQMAERERLLTELITDIKRRPFRYIAF